MWYNPDYSSPFSSMFPSTIPECDPTVSPRLYHTCMAPISVSTCAGMVSHLPRSGHAQPAPKWFCVDVSVVSLSWQLAVLLGLSLLVKRRHLHRDCWNGIPGLLRYLVPVSPSPCPAGMGQASFSCHMPSDGMPGSFPPHSPANFLEEEGNRGLMAAVFGILFSSLCVLVLDADPLPLITHSSQHSRGKAGSIPASRSRAAPSGQPVQPY